MQKMITIWILLIMGITSLIGTMVLSNDKPLLNEGFAEIVTVVYGESGETPLPPVENVEKILNGNELNELFWENGITDVTGLRFKTNNSELIIDNKRKMYFKVSILQDEYTLKGYQTEKEGIKKGREAKIQEVYSFGDFSINQSLIFSSNETMKDIWTNPYSSIKINHIINYPLLTKNLTFYYVFDLFKGDRIEVNHSFCDWQGKCEYDEFINTNYAIYFNHDYAFNFQDLIEDGFYLDKINFIDNKLELGFKTKNVENIIELDPTFTTDQAEAISVAPLTPNTFVIAWCNEVSDAARYSIYYTNGTLILYNQTVDATVGSCAYTSVAVTPFNSTSFVIGWYDNGETDTTFKVFLSNGTNTTGEVDVDITQANGYVVSLAAFNSSSFVIGWRDNSEYDVTFSVYTSSGILTRGPIDASALDSNAAYAVDVSAFNSSSFVIGWFEVTAQDATFAVYDSSGNLRGGPTDADNAVGDAGHSVSVATFNASHFVMRWYDHVDKDITCSVYSSSNLLIKGPIDIDTTADNSMSGSLSAFNSSHFAASWYTGATGEAYYAWAMYSNNLTNISNVINASNWAAADYYSSMTSNITNIGIGLCEHNLVYAYAYKTTNASFKTYYSNGTEWNGNCALLPDTTPPSFSNNQTNASSTTYNGTTVQINLTITDSGGLNSYRLTHNDSRWCYQETTNASNVNDGNCLLNYTGNYSFVGSWTDPDHTFDGDWSTFGLGVGSGRDMFINYTKPTNSLGLSLWQVKDGELETNLSLLADCWNQNPLRLLVESEHFTGLHYAKWSCYNGSVWRSLRQSSSGDPKDNIYEEAMWWDMPNFWVNESIITASGTSVTPIFNYSIHHFPITGGTMGWRVWANDSAGNVNLSNIYTFYVNSIPSPPVVGCNCTFPNSYIADKIINASCYCNITTPSWCRYLNFTVDLGWLNVTNILNLTTIYNLSLGKTIWIGNSSGRINVKT